MKITSVFDLATIAVSLRSAWLISRACLPTCCAPISPSISSRGVSAATESITTTSIFPERTKLSTISSDCSPLSGCETRSSSIFTPSLPAYCGSSACSASTNAQTPPFFCASAMTCSASVVLPEDSGPKISIIRPRGSPPTPSAASRPIEPVEMASTPTFGLSPSFIIESSPNLVRIASRVVSIFPCLPAGRFTDSFLFFILWIIDYAHAFLVLAAEAVAHSHGHYTHPGRGEQFLFPGTPLVGKYPPVIESNHGNIGSMSACHDYGAPEHFRVAGTLNRNLRAENYEARLEEDIKHEEDRESGDNPLADGEINFHYRRLCPAPGRAAGGCLPSMEQAALA